MLAVNFELATVHCCQGLPFSVSLPHWRDVRERLSRRVNYEITLTAAYLEVK